jgi:hypothetical protein
MRLPLSLRLLVVTFLLCTRSSAAETAEAPGVRITYDGIEDKQAAAIASTLSAARDVYVRDFGFDMPPTILCTVTCSPKETTRLYTDGHDRVFLSLPSKDKLAKPSVSGVSNLYGLCHELGHIAMYRVLKDRDWMTGAAAEGWAHFTGSVVVDEVYKAKGERLWPDPYDYRADGTARLTKQLQSPKPSDIARGAGHWQALDGIIGRKSFRTLFAAWQEAKVDPSQPEALLGVLTKLHPDKKAVLENWWRDAGPVLAEKREASAFAKAEVTPDRLSGQPLTLAGDDGTSDGKKSLAGGGHARKFSAPGEGEWYLRSVSVHGARYGPPKPPDTQFDVVLCDAEMKPVAMWKKPYAAFARGKAGWVRLDVPPTRVPKDFTICLVFRPTASSGVFVDYDASTNGNSTSAVPGKPAPTFKDGDWLIRVDLDRPKTADALKQ